MVKWLSSSRYRRLWWLSPLGLPHAPVSATLHTGLGLAGQSKTPSYCLSWPLMTYYTSLLTYYRYYKPPLNPPMHPDLWLFSAMSFPCETYCALISLGLHQRATKNTRGQCQVRVVLRTEMACDLKHRYGRLCIWYYRGIAESEDLIYPSGMISLKKTAKYFAMATRN